MKKMSISVLVVILFLTTVLFGCGKKEEVKGNPTEPAKAVPVSLSLGMLKFISSAPMYIGLEKGFFKDENLDVNVKWFDSSNALNLALIGGSLDVGASGFSADLYNMIATGKKVVFVADKGKEKEGYFYSGVLVSNDSQIKSIEDLKGKKIGLTTIGSTSQYMMGRILEKHGLTTKDVQWVPMNSVSGQMESLRGKSLDAIVVSQPNASIAVNQGFAKVLAWVGDELPTQSAGIFYSPNFAANKDAGVRFLKAYLKGARYYYAAVLTQKDGKLAKGENYDEVLKIVSKYTGQPEDAIKEAFTFIDPNGKLDVDDLKTQIEWYAKEKFLTQKIDIKDMVNTELLAEALKMVGK